MGDQSIRGYIGGLEQRGELVRFRDPVDPLSNLTAIGWKTYDRLGKASLFTNLTGFPGWQAVNQIVCDRRKWAIALGVDEDEVVATLSARFARHIDPVSVGRDGAPVKEVVLAGKDADLTQVPAAWTSEHDPGPYIASGMAVIRDPETGRRNVSIHRQQVQGPDRTGFLRSGSIASMRRWANRCRSRSWSARTRRSTSPPPSPRPRAPTSSPSPAG